MRYLLGLLFFVSCFGTTLTGTLKNPDGTGANGRLYINIAQQASLSATGGCGGPIEVVPFPGKGTFFTITNGALPMMAQVYGNDCLLPQGTYYNVEFDDPNGNVVFNDRWQISGMSVDVGTIISAVITGTTQTLGSNSVIVGAPPGSQLITQPVNTTFGVNYMNVTNTLTLPNGGQCTSIGCTNIVANAVDLTSVQSVNGLKTFLPGVNVNACPGGCGVQVLGASNSEIAFQTLIGASTPFQVDIGGDLSMAGNLNMTGAGSILYVRSVPIIDANENFIGAGVDVCKNLASPFTNCAMGANSGVAARAFNPYDGTGGAPLTGQDYTIGFNGSSLTVNGIAVSTITVVGGVITGSM